MFRVSIHSLKTRFAGILGAAVFGIAACGSIAHAAPADGPMAIWAADHRNDIKSTPPLLKTVQTNTQADAQADAQSLLVTYTTSSHASASVQHNEGLHSARLWIGLHHAG